MAVTSAGPNDTRVDGASERWTTQLAGPLLLAAASAGLLRQGAYYPSMQRLVGLLIGAATLLALAARPPTRLDIRLLPLVPALALAAWAVLDGALAGAAGAAVGPALLLVGIVAVLLVCRRLRREDREILLAGVTFIGLIVALTGWLGVASRAGSWAFQAQGLWRASSTLTYPNATAAVLAPISLLVLGRLIGKPGSVPLTLAATGLLAGLAATMSRAGALALVVGIVVLAALRGLRAIARAAVGPLVGALVAAVCLLPSMPAAGPPRPALALVGLCAGLALAAFVVQSRRWLALALLGAVLVVGAIGLLGIGGGVGGAAHTVAEARINLASPDRTGALHAALQLVAQHPLTGTGPGQAQLRWEGQGHGTQLFSYVHNEYLQAAAELGLVGLVLLAVLLVAIGRLLWRTRATGRHGATSAGAIAAAAAFATHSGFDFVWHLPAIVLSVTLLVGAALPAPDTANAHHPSVPAQAKEADESQSAN
jgi:O-Antigen ligase